MMEFAIVMAIIIAILGILATKDQSPNSSPQSVASGNALERGRFFFACLLRSPPGKTFQTGQTSKQSVLRQLPGPAGFQKGQTSKRFASTSHAGPSLLVCPRPNKQARQLPGPAGTVLDRRNKQACFFQDDGPGIQARQVPGPAGTVLERTDKQASVLGRRTKDSSTKKGYPKIALSH